MPLRMPAQQPNFMPTMKKLFEPHLEAAKSLYVAAVSNDAELPAPNHHDTAERIVAWKNIVDAIFFIKAVDYTALPIQQSHLPSREDIIAHLKYHHFARGDTEADVSKHADKIFKSIAARAHGALKYFPTMKEDRTLPPTPANQAPLPLVEQPRKRAGRMKAATEFKGPHHAELNDAIAEMKRNWADRLQAKGDLQKYLQEAWTEKVQSNYEDTAPNNDTIKNLAKAHGTSVADLFTATRAMLHREYKAHELGYKIGPRVQWPHDTQPAYKRQMRKLVESPDNRPELVQALLTEYFMVSLKAAVWEIAVEPRGGWQYVQDIDKQHELIVEKLLTAMGPEMQKILPIMKSETSDHAQGNHIYQDMMSDLDALTRQAALVVQDYYLNAAGPQPGQKL